LECSTIALGKAVACSTRSDRKRSFTPDFLLLSGLKIPEQTWLEPRGNPEWPTNAKPRALLKALQRGLERHPTSQGCDADSGAAQREEEHHRQSSFAVTSRDADFGDAHREEEHLCSDQYIGSRLLA